MRTSVPNASGRSFRGSVCWLVAVLSLPAAAAGQIGAAGVGSGQAPAQEQTADRRYIISFRRSPGEKTAADLQAETEALVAAGRRSVQAAGGRVLRELPSVTAVAAWLPDRALQSLLQNPEVERVEVDARRYLLQSALQSGPPWSNTNQGGEVIPYGISMVQADQLSDAAAGNRKVCIIDTGYYRNHDDLQYAHVTATPDPATGDPFIDPHGHGTHVAGTIAAVGGNGIGVRGINPSQLLRLHIIKAFGREGTWIYSSDLVYALSRCREAGANVISMSFSGPEPVTAEATAFADAYAAGVLPIAAAGNSAYGGYNYPASYPSVVAVAAVDANEEVAYFSQRNDDVELAAPGVAVLSTLPPPLGTAAWSGTSMATPHVAGVAALVWSYNPSWTNAQIRQALQQTAKDKGPAGRDSDYGYGIVQAKAALNYLCGPNCVPPPPPAEPASDCLVDTGEGDFLTGQSAGVVVNATGDVHLSGNFVERAESVSSSGVAFSRGTLRAQTFTARVTGIVTAAELYLSCEGCYGYNPQVEISIWAASGGVPIGSLAASYLFSFPNPGWRRVEFAAPPVVQAGQEYALVVDTWPDDTTTGSYQWRLAQTDSYSGGEHLQGTQGGAVWTPQGGPDLAFRVYQTAMAGPYTTHTGWLISSLMDTRVPAGGTSQWGTLSWNATVPAGTSIRFQVAGSAAAAGPFDFTGPDGTRDSYFTASGTPVARFERYLRYRAELATDDLASTPVLHDVTACYTTLRGSSTSLRGTVTDALTSSPLSGAMVVAGPYADSTDASGRYEILGVAPGTYSLTASAGGYDSKTLSGVPVQQGFATDRSIALHPRIADTTPPSPPGPITASHDGGAALADPTIEARWEASSDALSGVDGYSYVFDQHPVSPCKRIKNVEEVILQTISSPLADGAWYVHVCAVDGAGNWSDAAHGGPYLIADSCRTDTTREQFQAGAAAYLDLTSSPGDARLASLGGGTGVLDQAQTAVGDYSQTIQTQVWEGQIFTPGVSGFLTRLDVNLSCFSCSGPDPALTVEIRDVVGSQPGDNVLASTTIAGFSSPVLTFYTAVFSHPAGLTAGTPYAFVIKSQAERSGLYGTAMIAGVQRPGDRYEPGAYRFTVNSGASWEAWGTDLAFRTYMAPGSFPAVGTLESSVKDAWPGRWTTLSWLADSPAGTRIELQVAASNSPSGPFNFVGPDGTAATWFTASGASLAQVGSARYIKYKAFLRTGVWTLTPALHEVTLCRLVPAVLFADSFESSDTSAWSLRWP